MDASSTATTGGFYDGSQKTVGYNGRVELRPGAGPDRA